MRRSTKIVTCFLQKNNEILLLKRSDKVKTMKGLWAGVSGIIEKNEEPLVRAKTEIFEELGITEDLLDLQKKGDDLRIHSPQYENHEWQVFPFLFSIKDPKITLNWENSEYKWVKVDEISNFETVPSLEKVLLHLL